MAGDVHRIGQNAEDGHDVVGREAIDHDVPRCPHDSGLRSGSLSVMPKVVDATAGPEIVAFHRSNALPVMSEVGECGSNESLITPAGGRPEGRSAPIETVAKISLRRGKRTAQPRPRGASVPQTRYQLLVITPG